MLNGAVNYCGATVATIVIGYKVGNTCNGAACMGFEEQFSTNLLEIERETSNGDGANAIVSSPDVTASMLKPIPGAHDCC